MVQAQDGLCAKEARCRVIRGRMWGARGGGRWESSQLYQRRQPLTMISKDQKRGFKCAVKEQGASGYTGMFTAASNSKYVTKTPQEFTEVGTGWWRRRSFLLDSTAQYAYFHTVINDIVIHKGRRT